MKPGSAIMIALLLAPALAFGQIAETKGTVTQGLEDVGQLKIRAESGEPEAQVKLANAYLANSRAMDARRWYELAARQSSAEGQFQLASLLLTGRRSTLPEQSVTADPGAALTWNYLAATNGHKGAWRTMAQCLLAGNYCATNRVEAYAWLNLLADAGDSIGRTEMNRLALDLPSADIQAGKAIFNAMKAGRWPGPPAVENQRLARWLRLQGVTISTKEKLVIIGNRTLAEGEETFLNVDGQFIRLTCLSIETNAVQVQLEGEANPRILRNSFGNIPKEEEK